MIFDKVKVLCLIAFTLTASGCGSSNSNETGAENAETLIFIDDTVSTDDTTTELAVNTDTSEGVATSVTPVSSFQMDEFIENPLAAAVPAELNSATPSSLATVYITNPLLD